MGLLLRVASDRQWTDGPSVSQSTTEDESTKYVYQGIGGWGGQRYFRLPSQIVFLYMHFFPRILSEIIHELHLMAIGCQTPTRSGCPFQYAHHDPYTQLQEGEEQDADK